MTTVTDPNNLIMLFGMSGQLLESDLDRVEEHFGIDLGRPHKKPKDEDRVYYPQFDRAIRSEAASMAKHYEIFYCLERTIRAFIADTLEGAKGLSWWNDRVPGKIQTDVQERIQREQDQGVTARSAEQIDYTNFGELGEIIRSNWDLFGGALSSKAAVTKVMTNLNTLRNPIAHCCVLAEDEVLRLQLSVRDWFRLME